MEIKVKVKVFDDPEFCNKSKKSCIFLVNEVIRCCILFNKDLEERNCKYPHNFSLKCDECKELYNKFKDDN